MTHPLRAELARRMITTLPRFGSWANSIREFQTPYGTVGFRQAAILWVIRHGLLPEDELTPTRLAAFFRVQPSAITRALARLEASGLIERTVDPADSRSVRISITGKGRQISEYVEALFVDDILDSLSVLGDEEVACLRRCLGLLAAIATDLERKRAERTHQRGMPTRLA